METIIKQNNKEQQYLDFLLDLKNQLKQIKVLNNQI